MSETTMAIERCLDRLQQGDLRVRDELIKIAYERLQRIARKMMHNFDRVGRWEQTDDVIQNASIRLYESFQHVKLADARHFYRLAALQIRRELVDLCRHYLGPQGLGANHQTHLARHGSQGSSIGFDYERGEVSEDPAQMLRWSEFHASVERLPDQEREVFEMIWYHELPQEEVAKLLGLSTRQIKRIWRSAKLRLHEELGGDRSV